MKGTVICAPPSALVSPAFSPVGGIGVTRRKAWTWPALAIEERRPGLSPRRARQIFAMLSVFHIASRGTFTRCTCSRPSGGSEKEAQASEWEKLSEQERRALREMKQAKLVEGKSRLEKAANTSSPLEWTGAGLEIAFDLCYSESATAKMNNSLAMQLALAYSYAKQVSEEAPAIHITSYSGEARVALEKRGAASWIAHKHPGTLREVFRQRLQDLVYLSPDAEETLEKLVPGKVYVIGGIVDRTVSKRISLDEASGRRCGGAPIPTFRLPIDEHVPRSYQGRGHVLNVNTVAHILMRFRERGRWRDSILEALHAEAPGRFSDALSPEQRRRTDGARPAPKIAPNPWFPAP